jgi:predicted nucleic acid-binding protein
MFTIDTSVYINALNPGEVGSAVSQAFLDRLFNPLSGQGVSGAAANPGPVFSPTLLLVELAAAIARVFDDTARGITFAGSVRLLPGQVWVSLDERLAEETARLAAQHRLRGADAVYGAVAKRHEAILVTFDRQQLTRLKPTVTVWTPAEAMTHLNNQAD